MLELLNYRKQLPRLVWPKTPPSLNSAQLEAREKYMMLWHKELPNKYAIIEKFNHGFPTSLPLPSPCKTLEIGAGLGSHAAFEDLKRQDYHFFEYRKEFCDEIKKRYPGMPVANGDIHEKQDYADGSFNRIVAIHVLEHLRDLPKAVTEIARLLHTDGVLDIVIPCEGGLAHTFARKISAERLFKKNFGMDFLPLHLNEHVSSFGEIMEVLDEKFRVEQSEYFPLLVPIPNFNLCAGFRLKKKN